jgi:hypothetical protein
MTGKQAEVKFRDYARSKGYGEKIVGDNAYSKTRSPQSPMIRLIGAKGGKLQIYETTKGRYEIQA